MFKPGLSTGFAFIAVMGLACNGGKTADTSDSTQDTGLSPSPDTGSETGDDSGVDTGTDTPPVPGDCATYCADMTDVCMMEAFHMPDQCLTWCASDKVGIELGTLDDTAAHTVGCRQNWLEKAREAVGPEKAIYCSYAAASGGDQCGTWCENYCAIGTRTCTTANTEYPNDKPTYFDDDPALDADAECRAACNFGTETNLPLLPMVMQHFGYGDTVQCRLHHYQAAVLQGPEQRSAYGLHCGHGAPEPTELCLDDAEPNHINYCEFAIPYCPSLFAPGTDTTTCRNMILDLVEQEVYAQAGFESFAHTSGANLGCLNHHIMQAVHDPAACDRADWRPANWGPQGDGVCFD